MHGGEIKIENRRGIPQVHGMTFFNLFRLLTLLCALAFVGCSMKEPESLEASVMRQDEKMRERIKKSSEKAEKRRQGWDAYEAKQDRKYDAWMDCIMD